MAMDSNNWETEGGGAHSGRGAVGLSHTLDLVSHVASSTSTGTHKKHTAEGGLDSEERDDAYVYQKTHGEIGSVDDHLKNRHPDVYEDGGIKGGR